MGGNGRRTERCMRRPMMGTIHAQNRPRSSHAVFLVAFLTLICGSPSAKDQTSARAGYYGYPAIHGDTVIFTSEGDLWIVGVGGGAAHRLTSSLGLESMPSISPDGQTVAFAAEYEGATDVYTMPITGGVPQRQTWDGDGTPATWSPDGRLLIRTDRYSTLPDSQLVLLGRHGDQVILSFAQGAQAAYTPDGRALFFTRWKKQSSWTKRYQGGTAESLWRTDGRSEAAALTADWKGTSRNPMVWNDRIYFLSDRDGVMNVYSMDAEGRGLREESHQRFFDVASASLSDGRIVYACGADLWLLDLTGGKEAVIPITLTSDFDQLHDHWVQKPVDYLTAVHLAPDGGNVAFTVRGEVFTVPAKKGRIVKVAGLSGIRCRTARYLPDGKSLVVLSTKSGETEFWKVSANGVGAAEQWTHDDKVLRSEGIPSPDGHWLAHYDKDQQLWLYDIKTRQERRIAQSMNGEFEHLTWSPDGRWLAYSETANNQFQQLKLLDVVTGAIEPITSDRNNSTDP